MMDREPLPPPFAVGTQLRYLGTMRSWADAEGRIPLYAPGMIVTVERVQAGTRGTNRLIEIDEYSGEEIRDLTRDGYSVFLLPNGQGRIIWPKDANEWEVVDGMGN